MCGLVGYVGRREAAPVLLDALATLSGSGRGPVELAVLDESGSLTRRAAGRLSGLQMTLARRSVAGRCAVASLRNGGEVSEAESWPAGSPECCEELALAFQGIVENGDVLRGLLGGAGHTFVSGDDAETLFHLVQDAPGDSLAVRVAAAVERVEGSFSLVVAAAEEASQIVLVQRGLPVYLGVGDDGCLVASELGPILAHTRTIVHLRDGDVAVVEPGGYRLQERPRLPRLSGAFLELEGDSPPGHSDSMWTDIAEQPEALSRVLKGRVALEEGTARLGGLGFGSAEFETVRRLALVAAGPSWHTALLGRLVLERMVRMPVSVERASEFRYARRADLPETLTIAVSAGGEDADTLEAMREAHAAGSAILAIVNGGANPVAAEADGRIHLDAGSEAGCWPTKTFTASLAALLLLGLKLGRWRGISVEAGRKFAERLLALPELVAEALLLEPSAREAAASFEGSGRGFVLGWGLHYPVALEGAAALQQLARLPAEGATALEARAGLPVLAERGAPALFLAPGDERFPRVLGAMHDARQRGARVIAVTTGESDEVRRLADHVLRVPEAPPLMLPVLSAVAVQLLAYHAALVRGYEVDHEDAIAPQSSGRRSVAGVALSASA